MNISRFLSIGRMGLFALMVGGLAGCGGDDGKDGVAGKDGVDGVDGVDGTNSGATVAVAELTADQWANLEPVGQITGVSINSPAVVNFTLSAGGKPLTGLTGNLAFAIAKLVPATASTPSKWVSYMVANPTTNALGRPGTENDGTLVDNSGGSYTYTFKRIITGGAGSQQAIVAAATDSGDNRKADLGDLSYDPNLTHRVAIQLSGSRSGATLKNPQNIIYDFIPATGAAAPAAREIVKVENCNECHNKLGASGFHGGSRNDTKFCVVCHTDQRKWGRAEATTTADGFSGTTYMINGQAMGDFPRMIHQIHRGHNLSKTGYDYAGVKYNEIGYPMLSGGEKMCIKCHDGSVNAGKTTAQGDNWKTKPSRLACGSCHDNVNFSTGAGHSDFNLVQANDSNCTSCHVNSIADIAQVHWTTDKTKHNPVIASDLAFIEYEISSATASATVPAGGTGLTATVVFRIKKDGTPATLNTSGALLTGFTSGPSLYMAYGRTQDGKSPADYNLRDRSNGQPTNVTIANLMLGTGGSITGPDLNGYYTATINNAFPADATRRAVNIQGTFTQTAVASQGGANVARNAISVARSVETAANARRTVVDSDKCSNCHEWFKGHGGSRVYETGVCIQCHNPNMTSTGHTITGAQITGLSDANKSLLTSWGLGAALVGTDDNTSAAVFPSISNNFKDLIHNIHKGHDHESPFFNLRGGQAIVYDFSHIKFPGILNDCQTCHVAPTSTNPSYTGVPATALPSTQKAVNAAYAASATRANAQAALATVGTNADDIVTTPFSAACVACHDNSAAKAHITTQGGGIMVKRANVQPESCAVCHGSGRTYDVTVMHNK